MKALVLNGQFLTLAEIEDVALASRPVSVAPAAIDRVTQSRALIEEILAAGQTVYGVTPVLGNSLTCPSHRQS